MKVAIVHDWLTLYAGAERVLEQMIACYPQADLFALVDFVPPEKRGFLQGKSVRTSALQRMPFARRKYRSYLPLMPFLIEQFDLSSYDLILSSSHAVAKGVITGPDQLHICMCYSPIRYAWDLQHQYLAESGLDRGLKGLLARWVLHKIRPWDVRTADGVDEFIAISRFIQRRIARVYRRPSHVIYPPVDTAQFCQQDTKSDFYVTVSRMVPYKRIDLIAEAFMQTPRRRLVIIGDGPEYDKIKACAGPNVTLTGAQPFEVVRDHIARARAFIFAAEEDFGIAPIEAQASGTPVIAYGKGGALETIVGPGGSRAQTGVFFLQQTPRALNAAIDAFEAAAPIAPAACRANAERFSINRFRGEFQDFVESALTNYREGLRP